MAELELIGAPQSNFVRTTRMALEEKGVAYKLVPARPHSPDVDAIHPFGKIPVMRHGAFTLCESRAIIAYADRAFDGPSLVPDDPKHAAKIEQWVSLVATGIFPLVFPYMREHFFPAGGKTDPELVARLLPGVRQGLAVLARGATEGALAGGGFSLADMYALPILAYARSLPDSRDMLAEMPSLGAYFDRHADRPSFRNTVPPPFGAAT